MTLQKIPSVGCLWSLFFEPRCERCCQLALVFSAFKKLKVWKSIALLLPFLNLIIGKIQLPKRRSVEARMGMNVILVKLNLMEFQVRSEQ